MTAFKKPWITLSLSHVPPLSWDTRNTRDYPETAVFEGPRRYVIAGKRVCPKAALCLGF